MVSHLNHALEKVTPNAEAVLILIESPARFPHEYITAYSNIVQDIPTVSP